MYLQRAFVIVLMTMMAASSLVILPVSSQTPPPANGDWIVSDQTTISNQVIDLKGNLTVTATGNLTLDNVTLLFDMPVLGVYTFNVVNGGQLQVHRSNITSKDITTHFKFIVSGKMRMDHTNVSELWGDVATLHGGIDIKNDNVTISNCTIKNSQVAGIFINTSAPLIEYSEISNNNMMGISTYQLQAKAPRILHNKFHDEDNAIVINRLDRGEVAYNDIHDVFVAGFLTYNDAAPDIHDNTVEQSLGHGLLTMDSTKPKFHNNTINGTNGIFTYDTSSPNIFDNVLVNNTIGISCEDHSSPLIRNNTINYNVNHGIQTVSYSKPILKGNRILHNAKSGLLLLDDSNPIISFNEIDDNPTGGIVLRIRSRATIDNNTFIGNNFTNIGLIGNTWADIHDNHILSSKKDGVEVQDNGVAILTNNTIMGNAMIGVTAFGTADITASKNSITFNGGVGIGLIDNSVATLTNNTIRSNSIGGIDSQTLGEVTLIGNEVESNIETGIFIHEVGPDGLVVTNNTISANGQFGFKFIASGKLQFDNNSVTENKDEGVELNGVTGGNFSNNYLWNNGLSELTLMASDLTGTNNTLIGIKDLGSVGIKVSGSNLSLTNNVVQWSGTGMSLSLSKVNLTNSTFDYTTTDIRFLTGSKARLLNTTFDPTTVAFDKSDSGSELRAQWFLDLTVVDSKARPLSGAKVDFPLEGAAFKLNSAGKAQGKVLTGFTMTRLGGTMEWVHTAKVSTNTPVSDNWTFGNITLRTNLKKNLVFPFAPRITDIPDITVTEDQVTIYPLVGIISDFDTDLTNLIMNTSSPNVTPVNESLLILYTNEIPNHKDTVTLNISDGLRNASKVFDIWVDSVNDPPVLMPLPRVKCIEDVVCFFDLTPYLHDEEGDLLGITSDDSAYVRTEGLVFTMLFDDEITNATVNFTVSDGFSEVSGNFSVDISPTNDPPYYVLPKVTVIEKVPYLLDLRPYMVDVDTPKSALSVLFNSTAYPYVTLNGTTLRFLFPDGILQYSVRVGVSDGNLSNWDTIYITVTPVDDPPVIKPIPDQKVQAGETTVIDLSLYIKDEDTQLSQLKVTTDSKYVTIHGLNITILYPKGQSIKKETVNLWVQDLASKVPTHFNVTIERQKTVTYANYTVYLLVLVPLVIILTTVGLYAYRHIRYGWYRVKEAFIIYRDGRLLAHKGSGTKVDKEILGSMLTAVQSFAKDTVDGMGAGELKEFKYEGMRIALERGNYIYVAAILEGYVTSALRKRMMSLIKKVEDEFGHKLKAWTGDTAEVKGMEVLLKGFIKEGKASDKLDGPKDYPESDEN